MLERNKAKTAASQAYWKAVRRGTVPTLQDDAAQRGCALRQANAFDQRRCITAATGRAAPSSIKQKGELKVGANIYLKKRVVLVE